jgi:hypothetical protein
MSSTTTATLLALQPDEELIVPCAGRLEWKLVQNRVHGIAQHIRKTRDPAFRVRTWGCTQGIGVERAS